MRRTYRSKKECSDGLDRRDVLLSLDDKSSLFDAFYIQNIKQTKRELSSTDSSNTYSIASNRVRKRKVTKKSNKKTVSPILEFVPSSTCLTPDKSFHVKKTPDLFDLLLNSPNVISQQHVPRINKEDLTDKVSPHKETKTYKRKPPKPKIILHQYSQDTDKENSDQQSNNSTRNATNILSYDLLVENELRTNHGKIEDSFCKVIQDKSLLTDLLINSKEQNRKRCYKNRLTENMQSPLLTNSPLSSTPFMQKQKSKLVFQISPITLDFNKTRNSVTSLEGDYLKDMAQKEQLSTIKLQPNFHPIHVITDPNKKIDTSWDNNNASVILDESNNVNEFKNSYVEQNFENDIVHEKYKPMTVTLDPGSVTPIEDNNHSVILKSRSNTESKSKENINQSMALELNDSQNSEFKNNSVILNIKNIVKLKPKSSDFNHVTRNVYEKENFVTSGQDKKTKDIFSNLNSNSKLHQSINESLPIVLDSAKALNSILITSKGKNKILQNNLYEFETNESQFYSLCVDDNRRQAYTNVTGSISVNVSENEPFLGFSTQETAKKDFSIVNMKQDDFVLNLSMIESTMPSQPFLGFTNIETQFSVCSDNNTPHELFDDMHTITNESLINCVSHDSLSSKSKSLYDTCDSDDLSLEEEKICNKQPTVQLERLNDSIFQKYYIRDYSKNSSLSPNRDMNRSKDFFENNSSYEEGTKNKISGDVLAEENNVEGLQLSDTENGDIIITQTCTSDYNKNQDQQCFVTTRRRNGYFCDVNINDDLCVIDKSIEFDKSANSKNSENEIYKGNICRNSDENDESCDSSTDETNATIRRKSSIILLNSIPKYRERISHITTRKSNNLPLEGCISKTLKKIVYSNNEMDADHTKIDIENNKQSNDLITTENSSVFRMEDYFVDQIDTRLSYVSDRKSVRLSKRSNVNKTPQHNTTISSEFKPGIVLMPGKKWERSLSIYRRMTMADNFDQSVLQDEPLKGKKYRQSIISTMDLQNRRGSIDNVSICSRRSTFISKPTRSTIRILKEQYDSRTSICSTTVSEDLTGFLNEDCDDTIIELSKLSISDVDHEVTVLEKVHEPPGRIATARDYVLRRCNQTDGLLFDECYPDAVLKNCRKIGEGVYGEVFLWRASDGRARVMKIVPIAGATKVNGEHQKDFHEIISEIVIAMELSALRAPIAEIERYLEEGNDIETLDTHSIQNATDIFNEVLEVRCVYGSYPSRLLDLWELYDECKGSENDNPAILPVDQQFIVLELANAGQDLESYQFNNAEQAHALFIQVAFGLAVGEEAYQFEHRDLHWGNVLIAPTEQKFATCVLRGRVYRVPRCGVAATIIDYSLSRLSLPLPGTDRAALYNDLASDDALFDALGDYQFEVYRLMREKLGNEWKNFEPQTNILWLHYTVDKMITALRYKRTNTKIHKQYIGKLKGIKNRILKYGSTVEFLLTDNELSF